LLKREMRYSIFLGFFFSSVLFLAIGRGEEPLRPTMGEFMGINGHTVQFKPVLYAPTGRVVRDYHPVEWDLGKDTAVLPAFPEAKNRVNWEALYGSWKKEGYNIDVCLMFESVPHDKWKNVAADAEAYGKYFAKEFGPSGSRKLADSVEIGNEPGKWNDADYRTMFSSMAKGIREGDPKLPIATCALTTGPSHNYAKSVTCLEGMEPLYDILNMHTYAQLEGWPTWKRSYPEDPALKEYLKDVESLCQWRDAHAKGKPVWITEFGYDSSTKTPVKEDEFKKWVGVTDEQQAQWIVRSYLVFSSMPVDRAYLYFFNDNDEPRLHAAAGLTRNFQPKPSYWAVKNLYETLKDYRFNRIVKNEKDLRIQEYTNAKSPEKMIWAVWSPTGTGQVARQVLLDGFPGDLVRIETMPLGNATSGGESTTGPVQEWKTTVSETPVYLFFEKKKP